MCGRYSLATSDPAALRARFGIAESIAVRARYNVAPGDEILAVDTDREGRPRAELLRWGLIPSWAQTPATGLKMINARVETVAEKPAFRRAFERFRCLIPADGFYEWQRRPGAPKQPFHITRRDHAPFAFAGLWSIWHGDEDTTIRSCTILTRAASPPVAELHDRMPVILAPDAEAEWLDAQTPRPRLEEMLAGVPADEIAIRPVGLAVNDARYDGPDCLAAPVESGQATLF